jgi:hypothetical protein
MKDMKGSDSCWSSERLGQDQRQQQPRISRISRMNADNSKSRDWHLGAEIHAP